MRKKWSNTGVSEVVGTILILLMTVVLFASIIVWVSTIPTPQASIRLDMDGQLSPFFDGAGNWAGANITVVHRGGERLLDFRTTIFLIVQRGGAFTSESLTTRGEVLGLPYGLDGPDTDWDTGERWTYTNYSLLPTDLVQVTVVDTIRSLILWNEPLLGPEGTHPPLFVEKWSDRLPETPTIDVLWTKRSFGIHARVSDADGDLNRNSVYVYLAFLFGTPQHRPPARMFDDGDPMHGDLRANDGIYSFMDTSLTPSKSWDGGIVIFNATDLRGNGATSRLVLTVEEGPPLPGGTPGFGGTWNSTLGGIGQGDSGPEGDYGYNIYDEEGLPTVDNPSGTPTRFFSPGERVYVIARSTVIRNLENINSFILRDSTGNKMYPPTNEFDSRDPSKTNPAFTQTATNPWFEYQYSFTAPGLFGAYGVEFTLKDNAGHAPFFATDRLWITVDGGSPVNYPKILTYKGPAGWDPRVSGVPSNLVEDNTFRSTEIMWVRVFFRDLDLEAGSCGSPAWFPTNTCPPYVNANAGDIEIQDYYGGFPVKKKAGVSPVSRVTTNPNDGPGEASYLFYIDLLRRNQDPWVPGANYYSLRVRLISDSGYASTTPESYQLLATSVQIVAPLSTIDIVSSTEEGAGQKGRGVYWYENQFYWRETAIDIIPKDGKKPLAMATGDLNGDTKVDVVIGLDAKEITNVVAYYNLDYGVTWRRDFVNQLLRKDNYRAESLAIADLDGDGDGEIIAGIREEQGTTGVGVVIFWNDGSWSTQILRYSEGDNNRPHMRSIAVGDVNRDGRPDIVAADKDGIVDYYCNNVRGSWLFPKTVPCPGPQGLQPAGDMESFERGVKAGAKGSEVRWNSLALGQMDGVSDALRPGEPDADTTLDIVVSNNPNVIIYRTSVSYDALDDAWVASFTRYDLAYAVGSDANNKEIHSLAIGDMNGDGMVDVVIGVDPDARKSGVFRIRNNGLQAGPGSAFNPWTRKLLPHTVIDPKTGDTAELGRIKDLALGDTDGDGDLDIVYLNEKENEKMNNVFYYENIGDDPTTYVESNIFTDGWFKRREKSFAIELAYIDL